MAKLIALIVFVLMFLAGIGLVALGLGIGLLLLIVGMLGSVMMGIILGSRGSITDIFTPRGFYDSFIKTKVEKPEKDQPTNIWDQMTEQKKTSKKEVFNMEYRLLAVDMDGTVLTSNKVISPRTEAAIHEALAKGKEVLFATGRCPSEMTEYIEKFPEMKYAMCLSGALIFDVRSGQPLTAVTISRDLAEKVLDLVDQLDAMANVYAGPDVFVEKKRHGNLAYFNCQCFADLYDSCAVWVDDIRCVLKDRGDQIYKINFYCHDEQTWKKAAEMLNELPLDYASGIPLNFEISPLGVNKGEGLKQLSAVTGIPVAQMIAVGDEGNDLAMIQTAGLGVAMGNASDAVIEAADVMTADCDHDGVAEVIKHCLL